MGLQNDRTFKVRNTLALDLGYQSPSAFTNMFRRALGRAPTRYFLES